MMSIPHHARNTVAFTLVKLPASGNPQAFPPAFNFTFRYRASSKIRNGTSYRACFYLVERRSRNARVLCR